MTPDAAHELAKRIINTWRGGPNLTEWRDELETLDEGRAGTAFQRLRRTAEHAPTIARFLGEYRAIQSDDPSDPDNTCTTCSNSGWTIQATADGDPLHYEHRGVRYSGAKPCPQCTHGQQASQSQTWTKATRRRLGIIPARTKETAA
jgi:hypothetical protein